MCVSCQKSWKGKSAADVQSVLTVAAVDWSNAFLSKHDCIIAVMPAALLSSSFCLLDRSFEPFSLYTFQSIRLSVILSSVTSNNPVTLTWLLPHPSPSTPFSFPLLCPFGFTSKPCFDRQKPFLFFNSLLIHFVETAMLGSIQERQSCLLNKVEPGWTFDTKHSATSSSIAWSWTIK